MLDTSDFKMKNKGSSSSFTNMFTPCTYQVELLECAIKQNTIVCVNTEGGKRFLSTMLIRELMVRNDDGQNLAVLLLNDESLVKSQGELLQDHLYLDVTFCLKSDYSCLTGDKWRNVFQNYQVLTISPELLVSALEADSSLGEMISLIIFDDCHLVCRESHPYRAIMQIIETFSFSPSILGLTTSLLREGVTSESLEKEIKQMETLLHSTAQTATDLIALDRHSLMKPTENIILSADRHKTDQENMINLTDRVGEVLRKALEWLHSCQIHSNVRMQVIDWELETLSPRREAGHQGDKSAGSAPTIDRCGRPSNDFASGDHLPQRRNDGDRFSSETDEDVCATPKALLQEVATVLDVLGSWCVYKLVELIIKQLHKVLLGIERRIKQAMLENNDEEPVCGTLIWQKMLFQYVNTKLQMIFAMCHPHMGQQKAIDLQFVSPKVHRLFQVLKEYKPISAPEPSQACKFNDRSENDYVSWWQDSDADDEEEEEVETDGKKKQKTTVDESAPPPFTNTLCGIVFVEEKYVALMLHRLLREIAKDEKDLKHVISSHLGPSPSSNLQSGLDSAAVDKSKQEEVLRKFRCHETNFLVTTSSLEDCAHIPKCNLVVRFDAPRSYRVYAQSKSRARASTSAYVMLVRESEKRQFMEKLQEYKRIEQVLQGPVPCDIEDAVMDEEADDYDDVAPYSTGANSLASMSNAIKIVNRYCSRLPSDPFTHLSPRCEITQELGGGYYDDEPLYRCTLQLPINSHIREPIQGRAMPSVILAQRAVAVDACRLLHQSGELDDNLMPIGKETVKYAEELDPWKPEQTAVLGRPGSTKRRQTYTKDIPRTLSHCLPCPGKPLFIYEIEMKMKLPLADELNVRKRKTYYPEQMTRSYGVLTSKLIPQIPATPIFTRSGEETARLRLRRSFVELSAQQISLIRSFHRYIFTDVLRVDRVPLFFKPDAADNQLLIVVLNKASPHSQAIDIDWSFLMTADLKRMNVEKMRRDPWYRHRISEENKVFKFKRKTYEDAVVIRNYGSCDQPNRYYVAEIKDHLNPLSQFPSLDYGDYKHYYEMKYGVNIKCNVQSLLDVDHTPSRLNLLTPRHANRKGKSSLSREKKTLKPKNPIIFVPELCDAHPIPASMWRKAVCLPSVLYRVSQLLIGEELRRDIAAKSGIVNAVPPLGHVWPDIDFSHTCHESHDALYSPERPLSPTVEIPFESDQPPNTADPPETENPPSPVPSKDSTPLVNGERHTTPPSDDVQISSDTSSSDESFSDDDYLVCFLTDDERKERFDKRKKRTKKRSDREPHDDPSRVIPKSLVQSSLAPQNASPATTGPGPGVILQALTLSNASDGYNLERMEMLGDSFLKHAVTLYLYCTYPDAHEGKLSYMRSKKVSNYNLYRIGRAFGVAGKMTAHIFDPIVNWMPAGYAIGSHDCDNLSDDDDVEIGVWTGVPTDNKNKPTPSAATSSVNDGHPETSSSQDPQSFVENEEDMFDEEEVRMIDGMLGGCLHRLGGNIRGAGLEKKGTNGMMGIDFARVLSGHASMHFTDKAALRQSAALSRTSDDFVIDTWTPLDSSGKPLSHNDPLLLELHTQHSLSDKSIADSVEALLGAYLTSCGHRAAQLFLCHLGLIVLPRNPGASEKDRTVDRFGHLVAPRNYFTARSSSHPKVKQLLRCLSGFERKIDYQFKNKSYLLQAFTHASYYYNTATDCYQRLEFLGDAVLDFLITRRLCADERQHSPGALTDLRCALVNNTIFASLAVRYDFHKFFKAISPELQKVIEDFVSYQQRQEDAQGMDAQLMRHYGESATVSPDVLDQSFTDADEEEEETEDVEVPKALGDIFESVAGAIYMDSGMDLDAVWSVYSVMMLPLIEKFSSCVPRSPVRELLEMEPETAKFSCAEKRYDGKIRVTVEIIGKGSFKGVGRSYRIAKSAAARRALRFLKRNYC